MNIALEHPIRKGWVICKDGNMMSIDEAQKCGFRIHKADSVAAAIDMGYRGEAAKVFSNQFARAAEHVKHGINEYRDAILALPEAQDRPIAAMKIAGAYDLKSMPLQKAQSYLRALPSERADASGEIRADAPVGLAKNDAMLRRKVEIHMAGMNHNAQHGVKPNQQRMQALNYALVLNDNGMAMGDALSKVGINASDFK